MRAHFKEIVSNTAWLFADKFLRLGLGLVIGIWLARYLGPEEFGLFNYALAFVGLLGILASLGVDKVVVRDIVRYPDSRNDILGTAFFLKAVAGLFTYVLAVTAITVARESDSLAWWLVAIMALRLIFQMFDVVDLWFQSQVRSKYTVYARNLAFILVVVVKSVLILYRAPLIAFAWATLAETLVAAVGLYLAYRLTGQVFDVWRISYKHAKALIRESWPLALSGLAVMGYMKIDQIMIGELVDDRAVGIYSAAVWISEAWYFLPVILASSLLPTIVRTRLADERLYLNRLQKLYRLMFWLGLFVALITSFLAKEAVSLIFGSAYIESASVLTIHVWAAIAVFLGVGSSQYLLTERLQYIVLYRTLIGFLINVGLNWCWIPKYGPTGAASATLISYFISVFSLVLFKETRNQARMLVNAMNPFTLITMRRSW